MGLETMQYAAEGAYPVIGELKKNMCYAKEMLSNIGSANSEMSAVSIYTYNSVRLKTCNENLDQIFSHIAMVEMHHLEMFATLAYQLGADPRLWYYEHGKMCYWSPSYNQYPTKICTMLQNSLDGELAAIKKYTEQMEVINDKTVVACLKRIIEDEKVHVHIFTNLLRECRNNG